MNNVSIILGFEQLSSLKKIVILYKIDQKLIVRNNGPVPLPLVRLLVAKILLNSLVLRKSNYLFKEPESYENSSLEISRIKKP